MSTKYTFVAWFPELGETEESDGRTFEHYDPEFVAADLVEALYEDEPFEEDSVVMVRCPAAYLRDVQDGLKFDAALNGKEQLTLPGVEPEGIVQKYRVEVHHEVRFYAHHQMEN